LKINLSNYSNKREGEDYDDRQFKLKKVQQGDTDPFGCDFPGNFHPYPSACAELQPAVIPNG